jgi:hypothetical protein
MPVKNEIPVRVEAIHDAFIIDLGLPAKYVGQSHNRLLYCANPLHNVRALPYELSQIFFCSFHNFLNVRVTASHKLLCSWLIAVFGV